MDTSDPDNNWLSQEEVDEQFGVFTAEHWAGAKSLARMAAAGLVGWSGNDLLHEAVTRLLGGHRMWRRGVSPLVTLKTIMRSIANTEFKKQKHGPIDVHALVESDEQQDDERPPRPVGDPDDEDDPREVVDSRSQLEYVEKLVEDDEDCWLLVQLWAQGCRGNEAAEELEWDVKKYDAVRQRLNRRLEPAKDLRKTA